MKEFIAKQIKEIRNKAMIPILSIRKDSILLLGRQKVFML